MSLRKREIVESLACPLSQSYLSFIVVYLLEKVQESIVKGYVAKLF